MGQIVPPDHRSWPQLTARWLSDKMPGDTVASGQQGFRRTGSPPRPLGWSALAEDDLLQKYLAQYNHFPRNPEQLCVFAKNHGHRLQYAAARTAWLRATRAATAQTTRTPPSVTDGASSRPQDSTASSSSSSGSGGAATRGSWLERYEAHYRHSPTSAQHLLAFVNNRGGNITYTVALQLMGLQSRGSRSPAPIPVPLPWWQDTLAINRHYRRLTRMIFTTLVMERPEAKHKYDILLLDSRKQIPAVDHSQVSLDLARRLLLLASPAVVKVGSSCAICLSEKSDAEDGGAWVQLPCEHVLHRMCFRELVSCLDQFCLPYPVPQPISPLGLGGLSSRKGGVGYQPRPGLSGNLRRRKRQRHPEAAGHPHPRSQAGRPVACRLPRAHAAARRYPRTAHATRAPRTPAAIRAAACAAEKKLGGVLCRCFILGAGSLDHAIRDKPCVDDRATRCRCLLRAIISFSVDVPCAAAIWYSGCCKSRSGIGCSVTKRGATESVRQQLLRSQGQGFGWQGFVREPGYVESWWGDRTFLLQFVC
ncbi:unnamed protein product [Cladocopium goreaui]|uniref:Dual specificity protein kinase shkE n=1 Tax=Cladocopium goreaui TaxID=2562237 RepID=A0A9P1BZ92_9DINO|nr:unnamed protein product [Cladocopium goreaui]